MNGDGSVPPVTPNDDQPAQPSRGILSRRSGSQNRKRIRSLQIALTVDEDKEVRSKAVASGLSPSSYGRAVLLGSPGPRARRTPTVHAQLLGHAIAQLNRAGNVANQIAHRLNAAQAVGARETDSALAEIRNAARAIREEVGRKDRDDHQGKSSQ